MQNSTGDWVYGPSQNYTSPYYLSGFVNGSYTLYAFANNTVGSIASTSAPFIVSVSDVPAVIVPPTLTLVKPVNSTYTRGSVPVEFSWTGTVDVAWYNVKNGSDWVYSINQTYTGATSLTDLGNGTYTFFGFVSNTAGDFAYDSVMFKVAFNPNPTLPQVNLDWLWTFLYEGDFLGFAQAYFISNFNSFETAMVLIVFLFMLPLYLRTKSVLLLSILWLLIGGFAVVVIPGAAAVSVLFMVFGVAGLIWRLFKGPSYN